MTDDAKKTPAKKATAKRGKVRGKGEVTKKAVNVENVEKTSDNSHSKTAVKDIEKGYLGNYGGKGN